MRLTKQEIKTIKEALAEHDVDSIVYLFGSRVDENAFGGEIDIFIYYQILIKQQVRL